MRPTPDVFKKSLQALEVVRKIDAHGTRGAIYLVGGALREVALGSVPKDYDFALEREDDLKKLERVFGARSFVLGKKPIQAFRMVSGDICIDVTLLETPIGEDLFRRDFTINAMAYDLGAREVIDPLGGWDDIGKRIIRYPREESIIEDPLRMVKAIRHLSMLRGFSLDRPLRAAIAQHKALIHQSAAERIKYELDLILVATAVYKGIRTMAETRLLYELFPELLLLESMDREKGFELETLGHTLGGFKYLNRARKFYRFTEKEVRNTGYALLFHDLGKAHTFSYDEEKARVHFFYHERYSNEAAEQIMERLRFSTGESRIVTALIAHHMRLFLISNKEATEKATRRIVYKLGELIPSLVLHTMLDMYGSSRGQENESTEQVRERCREVLAAYEEWQKAPLPRLVTGRDLLAMGFVEGPEIGAMLGDIRDKQLAGEITSREEALEYAGGAKTEVAK